MLSYLSSWLHAEPDDSRLILCTDLVLKGDSSDEDDNEWVWVDVASREDVLNDGEDLDNVLHDYIIVPPDPAKQAPAQRSRRHEVYARRKKHSCSKLKVYPSLKVQQTTEHRKCTKTGSKRAMSRALPYANPNKPRVREVKRFYQPLTNYYYPIDLNHTKPSCNSRTVVSDLFERLSTDGWSVLTDPSGAFLTSSMVRLWSIRNGLRQDPGTQDNYSRGPRKSLLAIADKHTGKQSVTGCSSKTRKSRNINNELTAKPGHTSLIVSENSPALSLYETAFSQHVRSLSHGYNVVVTTVQVYLTQILDTMIGEQDDTDIFLEERKVLPVVRVHNSAQRNRVVARAKRQRKNGRKTLTRWNASRLHSRGKAVKTKKRAMGRGRFNCSTRRAF